MNLYNKEIIRIVCSYYNFNENLLYVQTRKAGIIKIKHVCIFLIYQYCNLTLQGVGDIFGLKHCNIMYVVTKINSQMKIYNDLGDDIEMIRDRILRKHSIIPEDVDLLMLSQNHTKSFV